MPVVAGSKHRVLRVSRKNNIFAATTLPAFLSTVASFKMKRLILLLSVIGVIALSCSKENQAEVEQEQEQTQEQEQEQTQETEPTVSIVTGEYSDLGESSVKLYGICSLEGGEGLSVEYGIEYSKTKLRTSAKSIVATEKDGDNKFCCLISGLSSNTLYYYRSYAIFKGVRSYGEIETFTTKDIGATVVATDASNVDKFSVTLNGKLTVSSIENLSRSVWFYFSMTETTVAGIKSKGTRVSSNLESDGSFSADVRDLGSGKNYCYVACAKVYDKEFASDVITFKTLASQFDVIDLGLSVCWASCNLGATSPEEYGGYYQWAGTQDVTDKSIYLDWGNCPYHTDFDCYSSWTKYIPEDAPSFWSGAGSPDDKTILDPDDDVAQVKLGGKWRMPTAAEWDELMDAVNCDWTWTTLNGVSGVKVTSRKSGYTDKWIFLPAAGDRVKGVLEDAGSYGSYWSSSLSSGLPSSAYYFYFYYMDGDSSSGLGMDRCGRFFGYSVRPVSQKDAPTGNN